MRVVIAEKPSVALSIAKVLGATTKKDGYVEGNGYKVTWCVGHLVELAYPAAYDEKYKKWNIENLPILPQQWKYGIKATSKSQYDVVKSLMNDSDTEYVVCGTDSGREGELIFRNVYVKCGCKKPIKRLWISSMEEKSIKDGFANLKDGRDYDNLFYAAQARERADWLTGMNLSRLFTIVYGAGGKITIGRVMTPTLAMIYERDVQIDSFKKTKYFQVHLKNESGIDFVSEKIESEDDAKKVMMDCQGQFLIIDKVVKENKYTQPPLLYDLTRLQQDCNKLFGFSANKTLDIAQELYEKKLTTYPRTDAQYISDDMEDTYSQVVDVAKGHFNDLALEDIVDISKISRIINNNKITDHHAIIITQDTSNLESLSKDSRLVYDLIALRVLTAISKPYNYISLNAEGSCGGHTFKMNGVSVLDYGFKANETKFKNRNKADKEKEEPVVPEVSEGDMISVKSELAENWTKPPSHYTEATLLAAMDKAGAKDMSDEVERKGLGTSATRASIIEKLIANGYVERDKKKLLITESGKYLISVVPDKVKSVSLTCDWENDLVDVAKGQKSYTDFMSETEKYIEKCVEEFSKVTPVPRATKQMEKICDCPVCNNPVYDGKFGVYCSGKCGIMFNFFKTKLSAKQVTTLIKDKKKVLLKDQISSKGTKYDIYINFSGYEPYSYTDKDGVEKKGYSLKFDKEFPKKSNKDNKKG